MKECWFRIRIVLKRHLPVLFILRIRFISLSSLELLQCLIKLWLKQKRLLRQSNSFSIDFDICAVWECITFSKLFVFASLGKKQVSRNAINLNKKQKVKTCEKFAKENENISQFVSRTRCKNVLLYSFNPNSFVSIRTFLHRHL